MVTLAPLPSEMVTGKWAVTDVDVEDDELVPHAMSVIPMAAAAGHLM
jgi:hypothetical protein